MKCYHVDAFAEKVFEGNPAAVCVLDKYPSDELMLKIAIENNLSETAFAVKEGENYHLRWFTPGGEIDLCGHATLGTSYVLFNFFEKDAASITFTRYNEKTDAKYPMGIPQHLLMVRKSDMYNFFEKNKTYDGITSFVATYVSSGAEANTYAFNNIASLLTLCVNEKKDGKADDDWNKVVLIPVKVETDSQGNVIGLKSNLDMESSRLIGGEKTPLKMQILYTKF